MYQLDGLVIINGADIWKEFGAFLTEEKRGGRENLNAILKASKVKAHVGVDIREHNGTKYSPKLDVRNQERDITLHFAIFAPTIEEWIDRYSKFLTFIKQRRMADYALSVTRTNHAPVLCRQHRFQVPYLPVERGSPGRPVQSQIQGAGAVILTIL